MELFLIKMQTFYYCMSCQNFIIFSSNLNKFLTTQNFQKMIYFISVSNENQEGK